MLMCSCSTFASTHIVDVMNDTTDRRKRDNTLDRFERIFVWVGSLPAAARACKLAGSLARAHESEITLGLADSDVSIGIERIATPLAQQGIDVRMIALGDRSLNAMLAEVRRGEYDLVLHADRKSKSTPGPALLSRVCPAPVWAFRASAEPAHTASMSCDTAA